MVREQASAQSWLPAEGAPALEEGDLLELGVCAIDGDGIGAIGDAGGEGFDSQRVRAALKYLLSQGLKVIIVSSQQALPSILGDSRSHGLDESHVLHVRCLNDSVVDLLKVAYDYSCFFITNGDVSALANDWRLPPRRQRWLRRVQPEYHVKFSFSACGGFLAALPYSVRSFLAGAAGAAKRSSHKVPAPPPGDPHQVPHFIAEQSQPRPQQVQEAPSCQAVPPHSSTVVKEKDEWHHCKWSSDAETQPAGAVLWLPGAGKSPGYGALLCMVCEEKSTYLWPYACELSGNIVNHDSLNEVEDDPELLTYVVARAAQADWPCGLFMVVTAVGGLHDGMRAIGVGTNNKARKRAARIALAATVKARTEGQGPVEDPSGDQRFSVLIKRVRGLFGQAPEAAGGHGLDCRDSPPPPPPGPAPSTAAQPPPPPPPAAQEVAAGGGGGPPAAATSAVNRDNLNHRVVVVTGAYQAESEGYLGLQPGDKICLKWHKVEPPSAMDLFSGYAFGVRIDGPSHSSATRNEVLATEGWFPWDLVVLVAN